MHNLLSPCPAISRPFPSNPEIRRAKGRAMWWATVSLFAVPNYMK